MKPLLSILCCFTVIVPAMWAQESNPRFLFDRFEKGVVIYSNGSPATESLFNYDTLTEKLLFMLPDSSMMELDMPGIISEVKIGDRLFEQVNRNAFYEKAEAGENILYIRWKSKLPVIKKEGPYGMISETGAIDNIDQIAFMGSLYDFNKKKDLPLISVNIYYLKVKNKFKRFDSFNGLAKIIKSQQEEIKTCIKEKSLDFNNREDVKRALEECILFKVE
ncbi:MAG: hypothetical protein LUG18_10910 [Candidatus Azobacteroides sp.]|nr:hypothetical protein [Candidatus Azobacteroides sp.]